MLLVEITINGTTNYVSIDGHALSHNWRPRIIGFNAPTYGIPSDHGGYTKMSFGSISFNPILFQDDWPPPVSCPIAIYYTDTTEADRELVFTGMEHISSFDREVITYAAEVAAEPALEDKDAGASKPFGKNVEGLKD